jgi:hypothetical protein
MNSEIDDKTPDEVIHILESRKILLLKENADLKKAIKKSSPATLHNTEHEDSCIQTPI